MLYPLHIKIPMIITYQLLVNEKMVCLRFVQITLQHCPWLLLWSYFLKTFDRLFYLGSFWCHSLCYICFRCRVCWSYRKGSVKLLCRVTNLCYLKMPDNTTQYRGKVLILNSQKLIMNLELGVPPYFKWSNNVS